MKLRIFLLLGTLAFAADARPIYRCQDATGTLYFQNRPCLSGFWEQDRDEPRPLADARAREVSLHKDEATESHWAAARSPSMRALRRHALREETSRLRALQRSLEERKALERADNYNRCRDAMRVAALCGKNQGQFICDEDGFRPAPAASAPAFQPLDNDERYAMELCAMQARTAY